MRVEIYGEEREDVLRLKLCKQHGEVLLVAVDENGDKLSCGNILKINKQGKLCRLPGCKAPYIKKGCGGAIELGV